MPVNNHSSISLRRLSALLLCAVVVAFALAPLVQAQDNQQNKEGQDLSDLSVRPIYVTTRVFQMKAKRGSYEDLSGQVFKMKTGSLNEYGQWINAFKKTYPGFEVALLRTDTKRVFRTSKPAVISLGKQPDGRDLEILLYGAQSVGDGVTPGTHLIPEVGLHFGNPKINKPVTFAIQPLEVESGWTYYFSATSMKMSSTDYVRFVRPNAPVEQFDGNDIFMVFAFSVELDKTVQPARYLDERQSVELQNGATKKIQPELSAALREARLGGFIRVRVEISPAGKVVSANIHHSSFPEMNHDAIAAARQWEFPATLFSDNKNPITGFLTFSFAAAAPKQENSAKQ